MLNFYDFIQVFVFTTNHHLKRQNADDKINDCKICPAISYLEVKDKMTNSVYPD